MNIEYETAFTFDDVLLVPQYNEIASRSDVDLSVDGHLGRMRLPFISANMDTVTESDMAISLYNAGGRGIIHRFMSQEKLRQEVERYALYADGKKPILSLGVGPNANSFFTKVLRSRIDCKIICIDVAHGHSKQALDTVTFIKNYHPDTKIIAGNVATPNAVDDLVRAGADVIKVGIGPGSLCSTRIVTGHGYPQLSAIESCAKAADSLSQELGRPIEIIADGGIRNSGDIAKAIAAGADYVMIGSLFAGTDEAPGEVVNIDGKKFKQYRGMASREVQNQLGKKVAAEGVAQLKECKGPVDAIIHELEWGLRSALTYSGASNLSEFRAKAKFVKVTSNSYIEGTPHGLRT